MRKSMTAIMALTLSVGFSAALGMGSVQAAEGWTKINEEWRYYDQNDQPSAACTLPIPKAAENPTDNVKAMIAVMLFLISFFPFCYCIYI